MIVALAREVSSKFIAIGVIKEEDRAVYNYSFQLLFSDIFNTILLVILSVIAGKILETVLYMVTFAYLRSIAGGYHASSHLKCLLTMLIVYIVFLITLFTLPLQYYIYITIISCAISIVAVFCLAPVAHVNKPLNAKEKRFLSKKSRITVTLYAIATIAYIALFEELWPGLSIGLSMLSVSGSMIVAYFGSNGGGQKERKGDGCEDVSHEV